MAPSSISVGVGDGRRGMGRRLAGSAATLALALTSAVAGTGTFEISGKDFTYEGASHKRQFNAEGVLDYAPHNLLHYSEDFSQSWWAKSNVTVTSDHSDGPLAGTSADLITATANDARLTNTSSAVETLIGKTYIMSAWLKRITGTGVVRFYCQSAPTGFSSDLAPTSEWVKYTFEFTATATFSNIRFPQISTSGDEVLMFGAMLSEKNAGSDAYIATSGAAGYGNRIGEHNRKPVTNHLTYPEQFSTGKGYSFNALSPSTGQVDPLGGTKATKLTENTQTTSHIITHSSIDLPVGTWTLSVFAKADGRDWVFFDFGSGKPGAFFDIVNQEIGTELSGPKETGIIPIKGTDFVRIYVTIDVTTISTYHPRFSLATTNNEFTYTGDGSSGMTFFGFQLNKGGIEDYIGATNLIEDDIGLTTDWGDYNSTATANDNTAPDGTTTGTHLVEASDTNKTHYLLIDSNSPSVEADTDYTFSFFFKPGARTTCFGRLDGVSGHFSGGQAVYFDTTSESVTQNTAGFEASIEHWAFGWYICRMTGQHNAAVSTRPAMGLANATTGSSSGSFYDGDGTSDGWFWGAQLTKSSKRLPFVGMYQTGFPKAGYTSEAVATNLCTDSEDMDGTGWTTINVDITDQAVERGYQMQSIDMNATTGAVSRGTIQGFTGTAVEHTVHSVFKAGAVHWVLLETYDAVDTTRRSWINLLTGEIGTADASHTIKTKSLGRGLWHISVKNTYSSTTTMRYSVFAAEADNDLNIDTADYSTGTELIYCSAHQIETGAVATSYIKTDGATATRAADKLTLTSDLSWYSDTGGTFVVEAETSAENYPTPFELLAASNTRICDCYVGTTSVNFRAQDGTSTASISETLSVDPMSFRMAGRIKENDVNMAVNGEAKSADTSQGLRTTPVELAIGFQGASDTEQVNGHIKSLEYYKTHKDDNELEMLSERTNSGVDWMTEQLAA
jgi:hypothetical protein